jgi:hypothetical protein
MPIVPKEILRPGKFYTVTKDKDGKPIRNVLHVTKEDLQHLHEVGNMMVQAHGLQIPCCMEHQEGALPKTEEEKRVQLSQRRADSVNHNKGWVDGYHLEKEMGQPKSLWALLDIPDEEFAAKLPTEVRFASPEIRPTYTSGNGVTYSDVITHIALTPKPVWSGQKPFGELPSDFNNGPLPDGTFAHPLKERLMQGAGVRLSLDDFISDTSTPIQLSKDSPPMAEEKMDGADTAGMDDSDVKECIDLLKDHGIKLHEKTTKEEIVPHLNIALRALKGVLEPLGDGEEEPKPEKADKEPDMGMENNDKDKVEELPASVTMSTSDAAELTFLREELAKSRLAGLSTKIDSWTKDGFVAPARATAWKKGLQTHQLSLSAKEPDKEVMKIVAQMEVVEQDYSKKGLFTGSQTPVKMSQVDEVPAPAWGAEAEGSPEAVEAIVNSFVKSTKIGR